MTWQREVDAELQRLHEDEEIPASNDDSELAQRLKEAKEQLKDAKMLFLRGETALNDLKEAEADVKRKLEEAGYSFPPAMHHKLILY